MYGNKTTQKIVSIQNIISATSSTCKVFLYITPLKNASEKENNTSSKYHITIIIFIHMFFQIVLSI